MSEKQRTYVSLIGPNADYCSEEVYALGRELGNVLVGHHFGIICGGKGGWMEAVCRGARESEGYTPGASVGILPGLDAEEANPFCDIVIPSGLGLARNTLVVNSGKVIIAISGGAGTLSELAFAWQLRKKIYCFTGYGGWAQTLAGKSLDERYEDKIILVKSITQLMSLLLS